MFITQHRNQLSYIIGFLSALAFALIYTKFGIKLGVSALLAGILVFEIFDHFFGGSPDIIVMGVDSEEDMMETLKKTMSEAIKEKNKENSNQKND
ncbi:hypothetical protein C8C77_13218 [Halanaerobium saccharolyticum]|uniref:Uncharacterized protein n=1 Tax=Halanaerobium saccharolyticum TaxID=43595 RepID=A0A4R7YMX2_9FIRM|nr:hypothetical protein [Halanaerobium saccharolyticum]RAK05185.1 hypothetical protein C7958_12918 [Halanaerobium saccharolyticum]TDV99016.1 hypothetical protein C8C77_13218 [Halanaerobium saccharolyticum]TDX51707.1 hypothetical protein C7956_13118 [Halanaerobium saccharolyticum]